jgi:uncharacterized repeat protein (TIGR03987 family)
MSQILITAIICMILALSLYSVGVWSERFAGWLKLKHLLFFWAGFIFDTTGTTLMGIMAGAMKPDFHGLTGALAIALMLGHALWASVALLAKQQKVLLNFHKFSLVVWILWLIPFVSGLGGAMLK